jgi:ribosomal protein S27AE
MVMWKAKSCPKCGGDIFLDIDEDIWFDHCLQCGYMRISSDMVCPQCGCEILLEKAGSSKFYHCSHCGHTDEFYNIDN